MQSLVGQVRLFPYTFAPDCWLECKGQVLSISVNQELFALIGNRYGGDGEFTFALPNLYGTEPIPGARYCICISVPKNQVT
ncbi:MAG: tail fiber protein [Acidobacteria bacterium]|nr:MAG: tail fiber protein [Acidobacteriota bacterium]